MMSTKNVFGNWTKYRMCGDYCLVNNEPIWTNMLCPYVIKDIFDDLKQVKVFSTLTL